MKTCSICKIEKTDDSFNKKSGMCKPCQKEYSKQYRIDNAEDIKIKAKKKYDENKDELLATHKEWYQENKEDQCQKKKEYYLEHKEERNAYSKQYGIDHKEELSEYHHQYYIDHKEEIIAYQVKYRVDKKEAINKTRRKYEKERSENDPIYRIRKLISRTINIFLKAKRKSKNGKSCTKYLPYSVKELINYLEAQFSHPKNLAPDGSIWMTWENHGIYEKSKWNDKDPTTWKWQLDHIIPHSLFKYETMDCQEFRDCWALDNLQPLSAKDNLLKSNKLLGNK